MSASSSLSLKYRSIVMLLAAAPILTVLQGCGGEPEKLKPEDVIKNSAPAMQAASAFHFKLDTSKLDKPVAGLFISAAEGDVVKPDKLSAKLAASFAGAPISVKVIVAGNSQYMTDPLSERWAAMSPAFNVQSFFDPKGIGEILANLKEVKDDGAESVGGTDTYRLKAKVTAEGLKPISSEVQGKGDIPVTVWIGTKDFLMRRVKMEGAFVAGDPPNIVRTIELSDFNKQATIETPVVK